MSSAHALPDLPEKLWRSCDVIRAPSVQPAFVYSFSSAQPYSINFVKFISRFNNYTLYTCVKVWFILS